MRSNQVNFAHATLLSFALFCTILSFHNPSLSKVDLYRLNSGAESI